MSSASVVVENCSTSSNMNKLNDLYSNYQTDSPSSSSSTDSSPNTNSSTTSSRSSSENIHQSAHASISSIDSSSLNRNKIHSSNSDPSSYRKQSSSSSSSIKLPYPILADHRDLSLILIVLQKETQTTSKKIDDINEQIHEHEKRLTSNLLSIQTKNFLKTERIKLKQKLDGLKKHERRVNLQIDYVTTKTEIKGLEEEQQPPSRTTNNNDECEQIKILLGKLRQKLDKMKVYMRTRNEQMKKFHNNKPSNGTRKTLSSSQKQRPSSSSAGKDLNRKRPPSSSSVSHGNKRLKSTNTPSPIVRLASRITSHTSKSHSGPMPPPMPIVRFINKTTDSSIAAINSSSPTTPASSSSTLSPPLIATTSTGEVPLQQIKVPLDDDDDDELHLDLDVDELFKEDNDSGSQETHHN